MTVVELKKTVYLFITVLVLLIGVFLYSVIKDVVSSKLDKIVKSIEVSRDLTLDNILVVPMETNKVSDEVILTSYQKKVVKVITSLYKNTSKEEVGKVVSSVYEHSSIRGIDPKIVLAVIAVESRFNRTAVGGGVNHGYTQVYSEYHTDKIKGRNIFNTEVNIEVGTTILSECTEKTKSRFMALSCYSGAVSKDKQVEYNRLVSGNLERIQSKLNAL